MRESTMKQTLPKTNSKSVTRPTERLFKIQFKIQFKRPFNCFHGKSWSLILMALIQVFVFIPFATFAKNTTVRKVQEVNFAEMDLKGTVRNPDGAYLVQKRGIKFMPLYDMQKSMDTKIRDSIVYAK